MVDCGFGRLVVADKGFKIERRDQETLLIGTRIFGLMTADRALHIAANARGEGDMGKREEQNQQRGDDRARACG